MPTRKKTKPRFLPGCHVRFQENGECMSGEISEILTNNDSTTRRYKVICDNGQMLRLVQAQLQFAPNSPVWVQTKAGSKPGLVHAYVEDDDEYEIQMLSDNQIVGKVPCRVLRYNALQAAIQEKVLIKQEEAETEAEAAAEPEKQSLAENSQATGRLNSIVKQEVVEPPLCQGNEIRTLSPDEIEIVTISDDEEEDVDDTTKQMTLDELLEIRKKSLPRNCVLNMTPNKYWSILYSPQHDVQGAIKTIRNYIETYGAKSGRSQHGGIGPVLYNRCLRWHLQGQCRRGKACKFHEDHIELTQMEAMAIEGALEPAITNEGPIYTREIVLAVEEKQAETVANNQHVSHTTTTTTHPAEAPAPAPAPSLAPAPAPAPAPAATRQDPRQRQRRRRPLEATNNTNSSTSQDPRQPEKNLEEEIYDTAPKRRRFQCQEQITVLLPVWFGGNFYNKALCTEQARQTQEQYRCQWEVQSMHQQRINVLIQGDDYEQMEQSQMKIPLILCQSLPTIDLRGKLLWDLNQLANRDDYVFLQVTDLLVAKKTVWLTVIPLTANNNPNRSLCVEDAMHAFPKLKEAYGPRQNRPCHIGVHREGSGGDFGSVPSHVVLWSKERKTVEDCRNDFFQNCQDDDECW